MKTKSYPESFLTLSISIIIISINKDRTTCLLGQYWVKCVNGHIGYDWSEIPFIMTYHLYLS